jgi:hypothetical protein
MKKIKQFNSATRLVVALLLLPLAAGAIVIKSVKSKPKNNITPIRVTPPGGGESQTQQIIEMLNGDSLSGSMLAYDYGSGVTWKNDAALGDIIFKSHSIARVKLQHALPPGVSPAKPSRVRLRNGDELIGELKMINSSHVSLNTWYGGTLNIPRSAVTHITPGGLVSSAIYEGPRDMTGWSGAGLKNGDVMMFNGRDRGLMQQKAAPNKNNGWIFRNQAFYSLSSGPHIGRNVKFTDMVNLEFNLSWRGHFQLSTYMFADKMQPYSGNAYAVVISPNNVYLQRITPKGSSNIGNVNLSLRGKSKAHFSIRVNRKSRDITLLIDGQIKQQWEDGLDFAGKGDGLMFVNQGSGAVKLNAIRVTEWDGNMPAPGGEGGRANKDELRLAGNNVLSGELRWVRGGKVEFFFEGTGTEQKIPLERVDRIRFATKTTTAPAPIKPLPGTVRAILVDGGRITFKMEKWENDQVTGESDVLEKVDFRSAVFQTLEFNLDQQRASDDDPFGF